MSATISGWTPDPHDADAPEDEPLICAHCGGDAEDGADVEDDGQTIRLCDECDAEMAGEIAIIAASAAQRNAGRP